MRTDQPEQQINLDAVQQVGQYIWNPKDNRLKLFQFQRIQGQGAAAKIQTYNAFAAEHGLEQVTADNALVFHIPGTARAGTRDDEGKINGMTCILVPTDKPNTFKCYTEINYLYFGFVQIGDNSGSGTRYTRFTSETFDDSDRSIEIGTQYLVQRNEQYVLDTIDSIFTTYNAHGGWRQQPPGSNQLRPVPHPIRLCLKEHFAQQIANWIMAKHPDWAGEFEGDEVQKKAALVTCFQQPFNNITSSDSNSQTYVVQVGAQKLNVRHYQYGDKEEVTIDYEGANEQARGFRTTYHTKNGKNIIEDGYGDWAWPSNMDQGWKEAVFAIVPGQVKRAMSGDYSTLELIKGEVDAQGVWSGTIQLDRERAWDYGIEAIKFDCQFKLTEDGSMELCILWQDTVCRGKFVPTEKRYRLISIPDAGFAWENDEQRGKGSANIDQEIPAVGTSTTTPTAATSGSSGPAQQQGIPIWIGPLVLALATTGAGAASSFGLLPNVAFLGTIEATAVSAGAVCAVGIAGGILLGLYNAFSQDKENKLGSVAVDAGFGLLCGVLASTQVCVAAFVPDPMMYLGITIGLSALAAVLLTVPLEPKAQNLVP